MSFEDTVLAQNTKAQDFPPLARGDILNLKSNMLNLQGREVKK